MTIKRSAVLGALLAVATVIFITPTPTLAAGKASAEARRVIDFWTAERRAAAIPRDLVIDNRGLGYLRKPDGTLEPYGHSIAAQQLRATSTPSPRKGPPGGGSSNDTEAPVVSGMDPAAGAVIGGSYTFAATVTDNVGVKSVTFIITYPDGVTTQSFTPGNSGDTWSITLQGFSDGNWQWHVVAKDTAKKGGNTTTTGKLGFSVDTGSGGGGGGGGGGDTGGDPNTVSNAHWSAGGAVQTAAGRIYFYMPANSKRKGPWNGYVCSGTVVTDGETGRSVIITAAHCVYDDANKAFARNVLFIPNQDATSGSGTDRNCDNDPLGCWVPSFGVVDVNWTTNTFPNNIEWDYAYYVVDDSGAHAGTATQTDSLDTEAGSMAVSFAAPTLNDFTHALGYSYSEDPNFMYCAEDMTTEGTVNWWLPSCDLSGGSSGGPWVQPMDETSGNGPIMSVNSWGYTTSPGMAGPILSGTSAACVFNVAKGTAFGSVPGTDGDAGVAVAYPADCP